MAIRITETNSMSWNKGLWLLTLIALLGCSMQQPTMTAAVCPAHPDHPLRFVEVFDGAPSDMASLVPDQPGASAGYWQLGYVYDAGRFVTVRCKYADGKVSDTKLPNKINRCDYTIDSKKILKLDCK